MGKVGDSVSGETAKPDLVVRAERLGPQPLPWTWAIYKADVGVPYMQGNQFYRSADEAWAAGTAILHPADRPVSPSA
jgi:hypothetical protein